MPGGFERLEKTVENLKSPWCTGKLNSLNRRALRTPYNNVHGERAGDVAPGPKTLIHRLEAEHAF